MSGARAAAGRGDLAARPWAGPTRPYDLVKEFTVALIVVGVCTLVLAIVFGSPDVPQVTISRWATAAPQDFVATAAGELAGTSGTATYGPPYTNTPDAAQRLGPICAQCWRGVTIPVDTEQDFVVGPLRSIVAGNAGLESALSRYDAATVSQRQRWELAYEQALQQAPGQDPSAVAPGDYGPVPEMLRQLLRMAQSGALTGYLLTQGHEFYATDYTKPLLFIADGSYLAGLADREHLTGEQWGMMNETGDYPGQAWLWLYTFWYQVRPFSTSSNADAQVWAMMAVLTLALLVLPLIPGARRVPEIVPLHRLIWRDYYRRVGRRGG